MKAIYKMGILGNFGTQNYTCRRDIVKKPLLILSIFLE